MGSFNDYLEKELLDHVFGNAAYSAPATLWVRLYTAAPNDAGGGTEATYSGYSPVSVANNATNFPAATGVTATKQNANAISFASNTGTGTQTIVAAAICDASTGGNFLVWGALASSKAIGPGDIPKFNASAITLTLD